eukprot:TRINITY_DN10528_c0_g1_i1.p1 TRINITY_DN10528_c0_g1~~TRINITY_DN10528_c0_g1_i1.p1  ORF type:complete len:106 (+),score=21.60 TRINITY_DN10528_c0_g1_i1:75-392(+)
MEEEKRDGREEEEVGGWGGLFEKVGFWKDVLFERISLENLCIAMSNTKPKRDAHYLNDALLAKQMLIISLECELFWVVGGELYILRESLCVMEDLLRTFLLSQIF